MYDGMEDIEMEESEEVSEDSDVPMAEEGEPESPAMAQVHIPAAALGRAVKAGETITLKVVSSDDDGVSATIVESESAGGDDYEEAGAIFDRMGAA